MKKVFSLALFCCLTVWSIAQTNIFPASGNVGIGTTSPDFPLEVEVPDNTNGIILGNSLGARFFMKVNEIGGGQLFVRSFDGHDKIFLNADGQSFFTDRVGIGVNLVFGNNPNNYLLAVNGLIGSKEVMIENTSSTWPDYVFDEEYSLMSLTEVKEFINKNKHLPNIPSAAEIMEQGGHKVGEINQKLLEKVEELTLYLIDQNDRLNSLESELINLKEENSKLKAKLNK